MTSAESEGRVWRLMDAVLAFASAALLIPTTMLYRYDLAGRAPAREFVRRFNVEVRRPEVAHTIGYAPSPDWTAEMIADAALRDAYEPVNLLDAPPELREAWLAAAAHVDDELRFARGSLLDAIAVRPGWPFYQSMLGQTVFTLNSRAYSPELIGNSIGWSRPMLDAAHAAPAALPIWKSLAAGYLQTWPLLGNVHDRTAPEVFHAAFSDPEFVRTAFADAARLLGNDRAIQYVPDSAKSLWVAFDYFANTNNVRAAWPLHQRWERAEWNERLHDLGDIERHAGRGDTDDVRALCDQWTSRHSVWDFDSPAAHAQAARILDLWPGGRRGAWVNDPLADVARYLLTRNGDGDQFATVVARQIDSFAGVPASTIAEVKLRSGDLSAGERIATAADDAGSLEWSSYLLALAQQYSASGDRQRADEALARLPAAAMETHEAILVRGLPVAAEEGDPPRCGAQESFVVHGARDRKSVELGLTATMPTIADVGVNRARAATILVDGSAGVTFAVLGYRDQTLWSRQLSGDRDICANVTPGTAAP